MILAQTELHQLLKFPVFARHFTEHKKENAETSLLSFIVLHYFSGNLHDKDYDKDMQLPFKTADCAAAINFALTPSAAIVITKPVIYVDKIYPAIKNSNILTIHHADIWQPPKFS
jgi:hypothetical protein